MSLHSSVPLLISRSLSADLWNPLSDIRVNLRRALANSINKFILPIIALKPRSNKKGIRILVMTVWKEIVKSWQLRRTKVLPREQSRCRRIQAGRNYNRLQLSSRGHRASKKILSATRTLAEKDAKKSLTTKSSQLQNQNWLTNSGWESFTEISANRVFRTCIISQTGSMRTMKSKTYRNMPRITKMRRLLKCLRTMNQHLVLLRRRKSWGGRRCLLIHTTLVRACWKAPSPTGARET